MKTIVTHISPDLDAVTASWLIKRFLTGWQNAIIKFVPAGSTLNNADPDENPDIIHVDTGMGDFDHHQTDEFTSSSKKVFSFLQKKDFLHIKETAALNRIVDFVNDIDHFKDCFYPDPEDDRYDFLISKIIEALKPVLLTDEKVSDYSFNILDAMLLVFKNKINAEKEIKKGYELNTNWGKTIVLLSNNEEVMKHALKLGYRVVVRKDKNRGYVRIKARPDHDIDLTALYHKIIEVDDKAFWFFHSSKKMILNGSSKNPGVKPSQLSVQKIIEILKNL